MKRRVVNRTSVYVFFAALLVRLIYLGFFEQPPVQFDARQYTSAAACAPLAVLHPSLWSDSVARDNIAFSRVMNDLIAGEQIVWIPYDPPSYGQALDWIFFSGPAYPAFLATVYHLTPVYDFWIARVLQAIIDSLTALLILLVMTRLISPRGGIAASVIWILYGPAVMKTGELLTETLSISLIVAVVWTILRAHDTRRLQWLAVSGALCSILAMTKASTTLLIIPILIAWLWVNRQQLVRAMLGGGVFAGVWVLVLLPWLFLVNHRYGEFAVRDPSYGTANFRQANILETEGYNTDSAPSDFWTYPVWRDIRNRPLEYGRLYLQKFRRLWWRACDDYRIGFPFGEQGVQWSHRLLVLFAAVGVWLWARRAGPPAWFAIAIIVYFAGLHTLMHVVSRYNLLAMPFVIGGAVVAALWMADEERAGFWRRLAIICAVMAAAVALVSLSRPTTWLLIPGMTEKWSARLYWIAGGTIIVASTASVLSVRRCQWFERMALAGVVGVPIAMIFLGWATTRAAYAEWAAPIDRPGVQLSRSVQLPADIRERGVIRANVLIDGVVSRGSNFRFVLDVDHIHSVFPDSFLVVLESFYPKPNYLAFMRMNGDKPANVRCWSRNIIEGPLLDSVLQDGVVDISLAMAPDPNPKGMLTVFGDLSQDNPNEFWGPSIISSSIERYYEGADPRLWERLQLEREMTGSARRVDGRIDFDDLSNCFGRQTGQYRIILRLLLADQTSLYY